ncbi:hypothetical protein SLS62_002664 [Diatrype stigma]|uniref:Prokaryotic-type class I peptide chain release factors domain-containing protein n=1 Tax=Diatrype stigma TaxID=117547 RepID=A0AAN9YS50_9PEZI
MWIRARPFQNKAYERDFDPNELAEARKWRDSFDESSLPKGQTSYSRSSGPGGQHVNKTESKATTFWTVGELSSGLPSLVRSALRSSKYYTRGSDSITIQAQTQRSRTGNTDDNRQKLVEEILAIYKERVPGVTSNEKIRKHEAL